jgi:2,3-bisphosphoglycerate-dependent phosphoglycerate mutase
MSLLLLMRHGQSQWNLQNLFTGWVDIPLSTQGIQEALKGGERIKHIPIDVIFTSSLIRAQMTAILAMSVHQSGKIPVIQHTGEGRLEEWAIIHSEEANALTIPVFRAWELNERMYGELQGVNKEAMMKKYGKEQVHIWRRSFDVPPPAGESLKMTAARSIPYFEKTILPYLQQGKNVFIAAHGNSLRSIIMQLDQLTPEQVVNLELATGEPILYNFYNGQFTKEYLSL